MLIDMIHDNHGELPFRTRYRDPAVLKAMGYEAIVIPDALVAVPGAFGDMMGGPGARHEGAMGAAALGGTALRKPRDIAALIDAQVKAARAAGMQVFFYGDALLLPRIVVEQHPAEFCCADGSGRLCPAKEAVYAALRDQVHALFDRWPMAAGLVMRTGEVYPEATPHMMGSPLHGLGGGMGAVMAGHCECCRGMATVDRLVRFIQAMHDTVIVERQKMYVHRAWHPAAGRNGGESNMHDDVAVYREVAQRVPESPQLVFSFKFTRGDFRNVEEGGAKEGRFNPCLPADERPKWIEFQCEGEYEGKGAVPNYHGPVWREFFEQLRGGTEQRAVENAGETAEVSAGNRSRTVRVGAMPDEEIRKRFGIWGWSRGGGWGGPYVQREEWIDVNVRALAELYRRPDAEAAEMATTWVAEAFGVAESSAPAPAIAELLMLSAPTIRRLLYVAALAGRRGGVNERPWLRDDLLDVEAVFGTAERVVELGVMGEALAEKREALAGVDRMRQLFDIAAPELPNRSQVRDLTNALAYFQSFAGTVAELFMGLARFAAWERSGRKDADLEFAAREHLEAAQGHWQMHTQRHGQLPGAPSMFQEAGLWERTNACLGAMEEE